MDTKLHKQTTTTSKLGARSRRRPPALVIASWPASMVFPPVNSCVLASMTCWSWYVSLKTSVITLRLHCMFKRRAVPTLAELARRDADGDEKRRHKPFKDYEPRNVHIDIKHLPKMLDERQKRYLYVAIGWATRWVCQSSKDTRGFMKHVEAKASFNLQTDNGKSSRIASLGPVLSNPAPVIL